MKWPASPEKRETFLVIASLVVYFLAFNMNASLRAIGVDPAAHGRVLHKLGLGARTVIGPDGRKLAGWRDSLENAIYGEWLWKRGQIAGDGKHRSQSKGNAGIHGATWLALEKAPNSDSAPFGDRSVNDALDRWGEDFPQTKMVKHASGYTILDNVYVYDDSVYLVTDDKASLPPVSDIVASAGSGFSRWRIITSVRAHDIMGSSGSYIRGVSWMSADTTPDNSTLFALWRTYSSLDESIDQSGRTTLVPPRRLVFPHNRFFTDDNPPFDQHWIRRARADTGFHPYLQKAAFPQLTTQFFEDWQDYQQMDIPFVFERLVVADRKVAENVVDDGLPVYSPAFDLDASDHWWEPIRKNLAQFLGEYETGHQSKAITYLHTQSEPGAKLSEQDHEALVKALESLAHSHGYELNVVSTQTSETGWTQRMKAIVKSSVIISVHGNHLMDSVFMRPTSHSTLVELFPSNGFVRDREFAVRSIGLNYVAWQGSRSFTSELPAVSKPSDDVLVIDANAIVSSVRKILP